MRHHQVLAVQVVDRHHLVVGAGEDGLVDGAARRRDAEHRHHLGGRFAVLVGGHPRARQLLQFLQGVLGRLRTAFALLGFRPHQHGQHKRPRDPDAL